MEIKEPVRPTPAELREEGGERRGRGEEERGKTVRRGRERGRRGPAHEPVNENGRAEGRRRVGEGGAGLFDQVHEPANGRKKRRKPRSLRKSALPFSPLKAFKDVFTTHLINSPTSPGTPLSGHPLKNRWVTRFLPPVSDDKSSSSVTSHPSSFRSSLLNQRTSSAPNAPSFDAGNFNKGCEAVGR